MTVEVRFSNTRPDADQLDLRHVSLVNIGVNHFTSIIYRWTIEFGPGIVQKKKRMEL